MVKTKQTNEQVNHRRPSPCEIKKSENIPSRQNGPRHGSAKAAPTSSDSNQPLIKMTSSDLPTEKRHGPKQKKRSRKHNSESQELTLEELQNHKERIINTRLNKELFRNMRNSILSLNALTTGLTEQVAQVREQQKNAKNLWNDLEDQLLRLNMVPRNDSKSKNENSRESRAETPETCDDSAVSNNASRQKSLPSVFRNIPSPCQKDSEVFNESKTNHIKRVAKNRSQENTSKAESLFPMVTQDLGMPRLQLISKKLDETPKKASFCTEKEVRNKIAKRLLALRAFQEKFIIEPNKGSNTGHHDKNDLDKIQKH